MRLYYQETRLRLGTLLLRMELMSGLIFITSLVIVTAASLGIILKLLLPHREDREGCVR